MLEDELVGLWPLEALTGSAAAVEDDAEELADTALGVLASGGRLGLDFSLRTWQTTRKQLSCWLFQMVTLFAITLGGASPSPAPLLLAPLPLLVCGL